MQHRLTKRNTVSRRHVGEDAAEIFVSRNARQNHGSGADQTAQGRSCGQRRLALAGAGAASLRGVYSANANKGFYVLAKPHMDGNPQGIAVDHFKNVGTEGAFENFRGQGGTGPQRDQAQAERQGA
jgi:hypothetical protein